VTSPRPINAECPSSWRSSRGPIAPVDYDRLASEIIACRRRKENSRSNKVCRIAAPAHRHTGVKRSCEGGIIERPLSELRLNVPRSEAVNADAFCCPLQGQGTGYSEYAALARCIGRDAAKAHLSGNTANVDDLALSSIVLGSEPAGLDPISADTGM
jgi:hypothetical protein